MSYLLTRCLVLIRPLKLIFRFYKELALANLLVTLACAYLTNYFGEKAREILGILIWFKFITMLCFLYFVLQRKRSELYYYQNLGVTKTQIGVLTSFFDFSVFLLVLIIFLK